MPATHRMHADVETFTQLGFVAKTGLEIHFDLTIKPGDFMAVSDDVRPTLLDFERITGYIRSDGRMYDTRAKRAAPYDLQDPGQLGVELLSDDPDLHLATELTYLVTPEMPGERQTFAPYYISGLPSDDTTSYLADFAPGPNQSVVGDRRGLPGWSFAGFDQDEENSRVAQPLRESLDGPVPAGDPITLPDGPPGPAFAGFSQDPGDIAAAQPLVDSPAGPVPAGEPIQLPPGYSIVDVTPALGGTAFQVWADSPDGPVPIGDPVSASVVWGILGPDTTVRPNVDESLIFLKDSPPEIAHDFDVWFDYSGTPPTITTEILNSLNKDAVFSQMLQASGTGPFEWTLDPDSDPLPDGLVLSTEGNLHGKPTTWESYRFTVAAASLHGRATKTFEGVVESAIGPTITTTSLGTIAAGTPYSLTLTASGSTPFTWEVHAGALPHGLDLVGDEISGDADTVGPGSVTIRCTNGVGYVDKVIAWTVTGVAPTIATSELGGFWRGFDFSQTLAATGTGPIAWSTTSGAWPTGVSMNPSGVVSGNPTTVGPGNVTIKASNGYSPDATVTLTWTVAESTPNIVETGLLPMTVGVPFEQTLTLATGGPTITWSKPSGSLPGGIIQSGPTLSGIPTAAGPYGPFTVRADNTHEHDDQPFTGSVIPLGVQYDNNWGTLATGSTASYTGSYTAAAAADVFLIVNTAYITAHSLTALTYNGATPTDTFHVPHGGGTLGHTYVYRYAGAGTGTAKTVSATFSVGCTWTIDAGSYTSVSSLGTAITTSGTSATPSTGAVTCPTNGMVLAVLGGGSNAYSGYTSSSGGALRASGNASGPFAPVVVRDAAASTTFDAVFSGSVPWSCIAIPMRP
ncbi:hypothetical protein B1R94_25895 [Mycolicibacterium litorale]|nr:hypothetical protein B1R94_25895 [Mycolicibacterium litorale]